MYRLARAIRSATVTSLALPAAGAGGEAHADILQALLALGYSDKEAQAALKPLAPDVGVSEGIKQALRALSR